MTRAHLTSRGVDAKALICRTTVIILRTIFNEEPMVKRSNSLPSGFTMETCKAKKAKQSAVVSSLGASSSAIDEDSVLAKLQSFVENLNKMNQLHLNIQAILH